MLCMYSKDTWKKKLYNARTEKAAWGTVEVRLTDSYCYPSNTYNWPKDGAMVEQYNELVEAENIDHSLYSYAIGTFKETQQTFTLWCNQTPTEGPLKGSFALGLTEVRWIPCVDQNQTPVHLLFCSDRRELNVSTRSTCSLQEMELTFYKNLPTTRKRAGMQAAEEVGVKSIVPMIYFKNQDGLKLLSGDLDMWQIIADCPIHSFSA